MSKKKKKVDRKNVASKARPIVQSEEEDELDDVYLEEHEDLSATLDPSIVSSWLMHPQDVLDKLSKEEDPYMVLHYLDQLEAAMDLLEAYMEKELSLDDLKDALSLDVLTHLEQMNEKATKALFSQLEHIITDLADLGEQAKQSAKKSVNQFLEDHGDHLPLTLALLAYFTYDFDDLLEAGDAFPETRVIVALYNFLITSPRVSALIKQFCEEELEQLEIILDSISETVK